jgi:hypothetical protein
MIPERKTIPNPLPPGVKQIDVVRAHTRDVEDTIARVSDAQVAAGTPMTPGIGKRK